MEHDCQYQDKIIEMSTDIKWIRKDIERRNGAFDKHIGESDKFRTQVGRNTAWRHAFKWILVIISGIIIRILMG